MQSIIGRHRLLVGIVLCLTAVISWGSMFPVAGSALKVLDPFYFTAIRYGTTTVLFILLLLWTEGKSALQFEKHEWKLFALGSLGFAGFSLLTFGGQKMLGVSGTLVASVMQTWMPLLAVLMTWVSQGVKPNRFVFVVVLMALAGVLLVITKGNVAAFASLGSSVTGDLFIFCGTVSWVVYTMGSGQFTRWSPLRYTTLTCILGTVTILAITGIATVLGFIHTPTGRQVASVGWQMAYMVMIAGVLAIFCWNAGNKLIGPINGTLLMNVVPVTTLVIAILGGAAFSPAEIGGAAITIAALVANNLYQRRAARVVRSRKQTATAGHV